MMKRLWTADSAIMLCAASFGHRREQQRTEPHSTKRIATWTGGIEVLKPRNHRRGTMDAQTGSIHTSKLTPLWSYRLNAE